MYGRMELLLEKRVISVNMSIRYASGVCGDYAMVDWLNVKSENLWNMQL